MARYKGVELSDELVGLIKHMDSVDNCRESLRELQAVWDNLALLGQMSGTCIDMSVTREAFQQLTKDLLDSLVRETLRKTARSMEASAQTAIDVLVRNLFERTADIGFLATDDDIRRFLQLAPEARLASAEVLRQRFREYVRKYSVYDNIILLDRNGQVLVQLDPANPVTQTHDPLVQEALSGRRDYVETFRPTDLVADGSEALLYSSRVTTADGKQILGVLCLCFKFTNETEGIFNSLVTPDDWSVVSLIDAQSRVIASSDPGQVPVGSRVTPALDVAWALIRHNGRRYVATTRSTQGYQGYMGPGWLGHVMIPVEEAFNSDDDANVPVADENTLACLMDSPRLFGEALRRIPQQAKQIQRELDRSVWNGNVSQSSDGETLNPAFSKILLWEVANTGLRTREIFEQSIAQLHETVVSTRLRNSALQAALAIDIMDRNLYERANDCRWWALTSAFRERLAQPMGEQDSAEIGKILTYINGLYTVYETLLVFDRRGKIMAVSKPNAEHWVGTHLDAAWTRDCLALRDTQHYTVSRFEPSRLYGDRPTYIYAAAIHEPGRIGSAVGGIGIIFDAEPQFRAILEDSLPRTDGGAVEPGSFAVFADRQQKVLATSNPQIPVGESMGIDPAFFQLEKGQATANFVRYEGTIYAVGAQASNGYREYKSAEDCYQNDVIAMVFTPLADADSAARPPARATAIRTDLRNRSNRRTTELVELATFYIGEHWFGVDASRIVEAITGDNITSVPGAAEHLAGMRYHQGRTIPIIDLRQIIGCRTQTPAPAERHIVIMRESATTEPIGLLVDALGEIPEIPVDAIEKVSPLIGGGGMLAEQMVNFTDLRRQRGTSAMLAVLSPGRIRTRIMG
ncbi:MAG: chemotaxis protein CheW, partial [Zoogloeaceae bacterium]|nr:chemotaxis protein CheW [Zoogloeaceae bacterium]